MLNGGRACSLFNSLTTKLVSDYMAIALHDIFISVLLAYLCSKAYQYSPW